MGKWVHRLSNIDGETQTATCAHCGPVSVKPKHNGGWRCRVAERKWAVSGPSDKRGYRSHKKDACERKDCPYNADHPCLLDVHHVDGDSKNHDPSNLMTLCAFCHRLLTYKHIQL